MVLLIGSVEGTRKRITTLLLMKIFVFKEWK